MRVSLINLNFIAADAIGQCLIHQVRFHRRRGDEVRVFTLHPADGIPADVADAVRVVDPVDLMGRQDPFFRQSDLYVYHYPGRYALLETLKALDHGVAVFYYHNVTPPDLWGAQTGRDELAQSQAAVAKYAGQADLVVTVSPFNAQQLANDYGLGEERIRVLPLAVPLDRFHPGPADLDLVKRYNLAGKRVLLYVGRVAGNKRVDLLVEALAAVRRTVPNAVLLIVGDHDSNPAFAEVMVGVRTRAAELGVTDAVILTGRVPDLPPYYRLADLYLSASLHEGFGVPLIEAMASGVPVVATDAGAQPWVVGEAGLIAAAGDAEELAAKAVSLLTDDARYGARVQAGLARAQDFSLEAYFAGWGKIVAEIQEFLVDRPTRPLRLPGPPRPEAKAPAERPELLDLPLEDEIELLHKAASAVIQPYTVRSGIPLVGPLVAWVRRNLTSHLREPYLDPTLRRQDRFNWLMVQSIRQVNKLLAEPPAAQPGVEQRLAQVEARLDMLLAWVDAQVEQAQTAGDPVKREAVLAELRRQLADLRRGQPQGDSTGS